MQTTDLSRPFERIVPGEFLVKFKTGTSKERMTRALAKAGRSRSISFKSLPNLQHLKMNENLDVANVRELLDDASIEYIEPNFIVSANAVPNDPDFARQWNLAETEPYQGVDADIDAVEAWDLESGRNDVVVGVIDSGVDYTHVDLAANIFANTSECTPNGVDDDSNGFVDDCHGINAITRTGESMDDQGHGTHVAGIIGAVGNNGIGIAGVAWTVKIAPCKFLNSQGVGSTADAIACLDYFADLKDSGVNLVATNNSWSGLDESWALRDAVAAHRDRGIVFVTSAGNSREDNDLLPSYPCSGDATNVVCVASSGGGNYTSIFSNFGRSRVHLSAPGEFVLSTVPGNGYDYEDGTSMAAPHVTGVIALLASHFPGMDWRAIKNRVIAGGDPIVLDAGPYTLSRRRVSAAGSLNCANSIVRGRLEPSAPLDFWRTPSEARINRRPVGGPIALKALHINCENGNGPVTVSIAPSGEVVTLLDNGLGIDDVAGDGVYSATWTPGAAGSFELSFDGFGDPPIPIEVDRTLKLGFPQRTVSFDDHYDHLRTPTHASTVVANLDADPELEILVGGTTYWPLYVWNHDGSRAPGWPLFENGPMHFSVGELNGDRTTAEIVVHTGWLNGVKAFDHRGAALPGWPHQSMIMAPLALADVDADGTDEVIGFPARRANGMLLNSSTNVPVIGELSGPATVADLDADGEVDFVSAYQHTLYASNRYGALASFPVTSPTLLTSSWDTPIVAGDVDGDGHIELVIGIHEYPEYIGRVLVLSRDGRIERTLTTASQFISAPALADLDGDGIPEIVAMTTSALYAWKGTGETMPGWPADLGGNVGWVAEPVVGDVSGDGEPEVVVALQQGAPYRTARVQVYDRRGVLLERIALDTSSGSMPPAIADIDLDGRNDLVVGSNPDWGVRDGIFAFDLKGAGPSGPIEWGQHLGGADHRGYYELGKNLANHAYVTVVVHGEGAVRSVAPGISCGEDCIERLPKGTNVTLLAEPTSVGRFNRWLGACRGQDNPCVLPVLNYSAVAAQFDSPLEVVVTGGGTVTSSPTGIACPGDCTEAYDARSVVRLTATPQAGYFFDGWSGACTDTSTTCTVVVDRARSVAARFVTHRSITIGKAGTGMGTITSSPSGIQCGAICMAEFPANSIVTLRVTPAPGSTFTGWNVPCPSYLSTTCEVTMDSLKTLTATFVADPILTVTPSGGGIGRVRVRDTTLDCGTACSAPVPSGVTLQLVAEPNADSYFVRWSGACEGTSDTCLTSIDSAATVVAEFGLKPTLRMTVIGNGRIEASNGTVMCASGVCEPRYMPGAEISLIASPGPGATFAAWGGACTGVTSCFVTLQSSQSVTATFSSPESSKGPGGGGGGGGIALVELMTLLSLWAGRSRRFKSLSQKGDSLRSWLRISPHAMSSGRRGR